MNTGPFVITLHYCVRDLYLLKFYLFIFRNTDIFCLPPLLGLVLSVIMFFFFGGGGGLGNGDFDLPVPSLLTHTYTQPPSGELPIPICRGQKSGVMIFVSRFFIVRVETIKKSPKCQRPSVPRLIGFYYVNTTNCQSD
jgi:hypothetical protein